MGSPRLRSLDSHSLRAVFAFSAILLGASSASASCQSEYCRYERSLRSLETEQEIRASLAADPSDADLVRSLIFRLEQKAYSEIAVARWRERFRFEEEPRLADLSAATEPAAEIEQLRRAALRLQPSDELCSLHRVADPGPSLDQIRRLAAAEPDSAERARCLQIALSSVDRRAEAVRLAEAFLADFPEIEGAWHNVLRVLPEGPDATDRSRALLEQLGHRFPSTENRLRLLAWDSRHRRVGSDEDLLEEIVANLPPSEASDICWRLEEDRDTSLVESCPWRVLGILESAEDYGDEGREVKQSLRRSLFFRDSKPGDWPALQKLLAEAPATQLADAWGHLVSSHPVEACPRLAEDHRMPAAFLPDGTIETARKARRVAGAFETCSHAELARVTLSLHLERPTPDLEAAKQAFELHLARLQVEPPSLSFFTYQRLSRADSPLPPEERLALARRWASDQHELIEPVHRMISLHADAGQAEVAIQHALSIFELHPENVDTLLALGDGALRQQRHGLLRKMIDAVEKSPHANRRHLAEVAYFKGRLARREGRHREASELLTHYFSLRQRFEPCGACDSGLLEHLAEQGDVAGLDRYLAVREAVIAEFVKRHGEQTGLSAPRVRPAPQVIAWLRIPQLGACRFPEAADYLVELAGEEAEIPGRPFHPDHCGSSYEGPEKSLSFGSPMTLAAKLRTVS